MLHLWTGLGYYGPVPATCTDCAKQVRDAHDGCLSPRSRGAGSITRKFWTPPTAERDPLAMDTRAPVLDGTVKRAYLARYHGSAGWRQRRAAATHRFSVGVLSATPLAPGSRDYTQAMMDLGAMCCTRSLTSAHASSAQSLDEAWHCPGSRSTK